MYPHFIEVHSYCQLLINIDSIMSIIPCVEGTKIYTMDGTSYLVSETYDELKELLRKSGTQIDKGDPRLDTSSPLSWDALTRVEMIGQPVWNSNTRKWMLLLDVASDRTWITLVNTAGGQEQWIEHDSQKYPLYRTKTK